MDRTKSLSEFTSKGTWIYIWNFVGGRTQNGPGLGMGKVEDLGFQDCHGGNQAGGQGNQEEEKAADQAGALKGQEEAKVDGQTRATGRTRTRTRTRKRTRMRTRTRTRK